MPPGTGCLKVSVTDPSFFDHGTNRREISVLDVPMPLAHRRQIREQGCVPDDRFDCVVINTAEETDCPSKVGIVSTILHWEERPVGPLVDVDDQVDFAVNIITFTNHL